MCEVLYEALCEAKLQNATICDGDQTQGTKDRSKEHDGTFTMSEALVQIDLQHMHVLLFAHTAASTAANTLPPGHTHLDRITNW